MPQSKDYNIRASERQLELIEKSNEHQLRERVMGSRRNTRLSNLLTEIYNNFTGLSDQPHPSAEFEYLYEKHSPPTIVKAKKLLGIRSVRRNYIWYWTAPVYTPQQAVERQEDTRINKEDKSRATLYHLNRSSVKMMQDFMKSVGYCASNTDVEGVMRGAGYGRSTIMHAKRDLGIASVHADGKWLWVQAHEEVILWLEAQLHLGPRPLRELVRLAADLRGWHEEVVRLGVYVRDRGFVTQHKLGAGTEVLSMNSTSPAYIPVVTSAPVVEVDATFSDDREVEEW